MSLPIKTHALHTKLVAGVQLASGEWRKNQKSGRGRESWVRRGTRPRVSIVSGCRRLAVLAGSRPSGPATPSTSTELQ